MYKNGWILLLALLCAAFLVSCKTKDPQMTEEGELVKVQETVCDTGILQGGML